MYFRTFDIIITLVLCILNKSEKNNSPWAWELRQGEEN